MSGSRRSTAIFFSSLFFSFFLFFFRATTRINHLVSQRGRGEISLSLSRSSPLYFFLLLRVLHHGKGKKENAKDGLVTGERVYGSVGELL